MRMVFRNKGQETAIVFFCWIYYLPIEVFLPRTTEEADNIIDWCNTQGEIELLPEIMERWIEYDRRQGDVAVHGERKQTLSYRRAPSQTDI